jgi:hypothetical protein
MPYRFRASYNNNYICVTFLFFSCPQRHLHRCPCTIFLLSLLLLNNNNNNNNNNICASIRLSASRASVNVTG